MRNPDHPWLTRDAVTLLDALLKPIDKGVEFGSGRSTVWFAKRLNSLTSIENDELWYRKVSSSLKEQKLDGHVDYRLVTDLASYSLQGSGFADNSIDFCLVDGVMRDECAKTMLNKIRSGGLLVVDNVNWYLPNENFCSPDSMSVGQFASDLWKEFEMHTRSWRRVWTSNGVTDTCVFIKP
jgi:predicted O-methyltransferase YrrM